MDWKDIAPIVGAIAPAAGSIIGGLIPFPGGQLIGAALGRAVGSALGVRDPTPQNTSDALAVASEETKRAAINAAVEQSRIQVEGFAELEKATLEAMTRNAADVNVTMRAEASQPESLFYRGWRPAFGWTFVAVWGAFGLALTYVTLRAAWLSADPLKTLTDAWPLFGMYFGPGAAVLGVLIPSRSYEKGKAMETGGLMPNTAPPPVRHSLMPLQLPKLPLPPHRPGVDRPQTGGG